MREQTNQVIYTFIDIYIYVYIYIYIYIHIYIHVYSPRWQSTHTKDKTHTIATYATTIASLTHTHTHQQYITAWQKITMNTHPVATYVAGITSHTCAHTLSLCHTHSHTFQ